MRPKSIGPNRDEVELEDVRQTSATIGVVPDPWTFLSQWTTARIALGRTGASTPTEAVLAFAADHATARDGIHTGLDVTTLKEGLDVRSLPSQVVRSRALTRTDYLARPDLGRSLDEQSRMAVTLRECTVPSRLSVAIADGLAAKAALRHALPLLDQLLPQLTSWSLDTIFLAVQARVALGDEIGYLRHAEAVLMLVGERPGLRAQDSLGAYLTYRPRPGRTDAERNCVSNIRVGGLSYEEAGARIAGLLAGARALKASGVGLKEDSAGGLLASP